MAERTTRFTPALWVTAGALGALAASQAVQLLESDARAELVSSAGAYTLMTAEGTTDEILLVIDERQELLLVYRVENQNAVELYQRYELARIFTDARGRGRK